MAAYVYGSVARGDDWPDSALDLADAWIRQLRLGVPGNARESFALLERGGLIDALLSQRLQKMVGFRNIAVHPYQKLDLNIVASAIGAGLDDLLAFAETVRGQLQDE